MLLGVKNSQVYNNKAAGLAVSVCGATVRPKRGKSLGGRCYEAESPYQWC